MSSSLESLDLDDDTVSYEDVSNSSREKIDLWNSPIRTLKYAICELFLRINSYLIWGLRHKKRIIPIIFTLFIIYLSTFIDGKHARIINRSKHLVLWYGYWIGLGFLSSVGLGTGLHTFVLYLGPFIAMVTLAGWECMSVNFPSPPYPNDVLCPENIGGMNMGKINFWIIFQKIKWESFFWGAGTALGELPPFFMARAAALSKNELYNKDESLEEYEKLTHESFNNLSFVDRCKATILNTVSKTGFWGILMFASIPNPLFDLAGIACGHCLVPFKTFFSATLLGKSIIKTTIQTSFVIISFSPKYVESILKKLSWVPVIGSFIQKTFSNVVEFQRVKLHQLQKGASSSNITGHMNKNWFSYLFDKFIVMMVLYFLLSIINSMAQVYCSRFETTVRFISKKKTL